MVENGDYRGSDRDEPRSVSWESTITRERARNTAKEKKFLMILPMVKLSNVPLQNYKP